MRDSMKRVEAARSASVGDDAEDVHVESMGVREG